MRNLKVLAYRRTKNDCIEEVTVGLYTGWLYGMQVYAMLIGEDLVEQAQTDLNVIYEKAFYVRTLMELTTLVNAYQKSFLEETDLDLNGYIVYEEAKLIEMMEYAHDDGRIYRLLITDEVPPVPIEVNGVTINRDATYGVLIHDRTDPTLVSLKSTTEAPTLIHGRDVMEMITNSMYNDNLVTDWAVAISRMFEAPRLVIERLIPGEKPEWEHYHSIMLQDCRRVIELSKECNSYTIAKQE
jgi:hypothetical protein